MRITPVRHHTPRDKIREQNRVRGKTADQPADQPANPSATKPAKAAANSAASLLEKSERMMNISQNGLPGPSVMRDRSVMRGRNVMTGRNTIAGHSVMRGQNKTAGLQINIASRTQKEAANLHLTKILVPTLLLNHRLVLNQRPVPNRHLAASKIVKQIVQHLTDQPATPTANHLARNPIASRAATIPCDAENEGKHLLLGQNKLP